MTSAAKKTYLGWHELKSQVQDIIRQLHNDNWRPDYVVGITRGGLVPANLISQYLDCRMEALKVKLRDCKEGEECESNCWMAEDAFNGKKILIVDDINDSGATINWILQDWQSSCLPYDTQWDNDIWGNNVRVAVLYDNESSQSDIVPTYSAVTINKAEKDEWIVFPWEDWWRS